jgi:hypothetical protein
MIKHYEIFSPSCPSPSSSEIDNPYDFETEMEQWVQHENWRNRDCQ